MVLRYRTNPCLPARQAFAWDSNKQAVVGLKIEIVKPGSDVGLFNLLSLLF